MFDYDKLDDSHDKDTTPPAAAAAPRVLPPPLNLRPRILCLHGGGSNGNIMRFQVSPLKQLLGEKVEWHFLEGGRSWEFAAGQEPPAIMKSLAGDMPFRGWYGVVHDDDSDRSYSEKLFDLSVEFTYQEVEAAVDRIVEHMRAMGPFDVVLGFSQGCVMSHLVAATLRDRGEPLPWRLSLLFNGMRVRDERYRRLFEPPLALPCVMVFGRTDEFFEYGRASQLELYEDPVILEHEEGHRFPSRQPRAKEIYQEVARQVLRHCGLPSG